jgi:hypothetical protein
MPNMLIRNGIIIDGTDREAFKGSVYVIGEGNHYGCYGKLRVLCGTG